jgi:hypothetical protein
MRGGFLVRLAKMEHLDNQRDSEKNRSAIRKLSARNAQIRGLFGSPPKAGDFFSDEEIERVDERGVTKRPDLNELDVPDWAELALDEVERDDFA